MARGRPRTISYPSAQMVQLGKEMIAWLGCHPEALHLSAWYSIVKGYMDSEWDTMTRRQEFIPYYEQALKIVGQKYLDRDSKVRDGISQRWQRVYFKDIRLQEDQDAQEKLNREYEKKIKEIEFEAKQRQINETPPLADTIDMQNENMVLKAKIRELESKIADLR